MEVAIVTFTRKLCYQSLLLAKNLSHVCIECNRKAMLLYRNV